MKVRKSTLHKLEVERECGCLVAGDYEDSVYKRPRGEAVFKACAKHDGAMGEVVEEMMREILVKEASEVKLPEIVPVNHPRTVARQDTPSEDVSAGPSVRSLRTAGASSAGAAGHRPANAPAPTAGRSGAHRPSPGGDPDKKSAYIRSDPNKGLSAAALSKLGAAKEEGGLEISFGDASEAVPEDKRVTKLVHELGFLNEKDDEDDDEIDFEE